MTPNLWEQFRRHFQEAGGQPYATTATKAVDLLQTIIAGANGKQLLFEASAISEFSLHPEAWLPESSFSITPAPTPKGWDRKRRLERLLTVDMVVSTADFLIAETGSALVILQKHPGQWHLWLPPGIILLAAPHQLVDSLTTAFHRLAQQSSLLQQGYVLLTGPSKTADIEKRLVMGMHGPRMVYVLLIEDAPFPGG